MSHKYHCLAKLEGQKWLKLKMFFRKWWDIVAFHFSRAAKERANSSVKLQYESILTVYISSYSDADNKCWLIFFCIWHCVSTSHAFPFFFQEQIRSTLNMEILILVLNSKKWSKLIHTTTFWSCFQNSIEDNSYVTRGACFIVPWTGRNSQ